MKGKEGSEEQSHKKERREGGDGTEEKVQGLLAREGALYLDIGARDHDFPVTPLLMVPVCLLTQGLLEEPVRSCNSSLQKSL